MMTVGLELVISRCLMIRWLKKSTKKRKVGARASSNPARGYTPRGAGPKLSSGAAASTGSVQKRYNAPSARVRRKKKPAQVAWYFRRKLWVGLFSVGLMASIVGAIFIVILAHDLPDIDNLKSEKKQHGIRIVSEDGTLVATFGEIYGDTIPYDAFPKSLIQAVVATEDRRFFSHGGVDAFGIARAMFVNARAGRVVQGGSTITQQLAKNMFLTPERTLKRKAQEAILAFYLEGKYRKQEILAIYLNRVYLGAGAYGVDAAARRYFDKSARDLSLHESALIAGLLKAPSRYAPTANAKRARDRARQVLINMEDAGMIDEAQMKRATLALNQPVSARVVEGSGSRYFADWVVDSVPDYVGDVDTDLVVTTTIDTVMQRKAEDALTNVMATAGPAKNIKQAALVSMRPDGAVRAMVGGINYGSSQYNRAAQARRQAGSTFKLFVYLAALESGYTPQSLVLDAPITLTVGNKVWSPTNFSGKYKGEIPLLVAVRESINTAAVRVSQAVGLYRVSSMAKRLGIGSVTSSPSMALGAVDVSLIEITGAYAHLPNRGVSVKPYGITKIATVKGDVLYERADASGSQSLSENVVDMMNYLLRGAVNSGTATRAALAGRDVAGKTGTSQDFKDAWFVGYTPQLATGVWVGNDDNVQMKQVTGGNVPAMIWHDYMAAALVDMPAEPLPVSEGAVEGFFPWQTGSPAVPAVEGDVVADPLAGTTEGTMQTTPVPFGAPTPEGGEAAQVPVGSTETVAPVVQPPVVQPEQPAQEEGAEILDEKFWNQLMDEASQQKLEYKYPDKR